MRLQSFYIATRPKEDEVEAIASEDISVVSLDGSENYFAEPVEVSVQSSHLHPTSNISVESEVTFGPIHNTVEDTEVTLIYDGPAMPFSPTNTQDVVVLNVHSANTLNDMITGFSDDDILRKSVDVKRILPDNKEEAGVGSGVLRDVLSCFWQEFYERCTLGTAIKVPYIRHDFTAEKWKAVARIIIKGYLDCSYFPNKLAPVFIEQVLFNCVYSDPTHHFLLFVSSQEREVLKEAMEDFSKVDLDDLVEALDSYGCRRRITAENFPEILLEIAHQELVQKPMFVIDCWREVTLGHIFISPEELVQLYSDLQPTPKKVCQLLKFPEQLTPKQEEVANHLKRYIRELDESQLQKFLRFCTGSNLVTTVSIFVEFQEMSDFTRRPIGHTCGNILEIAESYENFPDFRSEFNAVLESNIWVMDIV